MNELIVQCRMLTNHDLEQQLKLLAQRERQNLASLLVHLAEYDRRRLANRKGYESTFMYCVRALRYDEGGAYRRLHAARVVARYPASLPFVVNGELTLTSLLLLSPILSQSNSHNLLERARGLTKRELEVVIAELHPHPPLPDSIRRLPVPPAWSCTRAAVSSGEAVVSSSEMMGVLPTRPPKEWQAVMPLNTDRVRIGFDADTIVSQLIERARQILRHKYPQGRLEDVIREALATFLERKDPQRRLEFRKKSESTSVLIAGHGAASPASAKPEPPKAPQPRACAGKLSRYIPAKIRDEVWGRDGGRCVWRFADGMPCGSRDRLEFDHVRPFARGGRSDEACNIRLLCSLHNRLAAQAAGLGSWRRRA